MKMRMKMRRMEMRKTKTGRVILFMLAVTAALAVGLAGCTSIKLPEGFDEDAVKEQAAKVIDCINTGDLETLGQLPMLEELRGTFSPESMEAILAQYVGNRGAFVKYEAVTAVGTTGEDGTEYAVVVSVVSYENQKVTYTITFNRELEIAGFYLK